MSEKACFWTWLGFLGAVCILGIAWGYASNAPIRYLNRMHEIRVMEAKAAHDVLRDALRGSRALFDQENS